MPRSFVAIFRSSILADFGNYHTVVQALARLSSDATWNEIVEAVSAALSHNAEALDSFHEAAMRSVPPAA